MKYMLCFFPWVGAAVGGCLYLWCALCGKFAVGNLCRSAVGAALPLVITGGFHADGFMDTMDALCACGSRERKLEILKDAHIGAFAVIMFGMYGLLYLGALSEVRDGGLLGAVCGGFFLSRCLSGIGVLTLPRAKKDGMLSGFAECSQECIAKWALCLQGVCCAGFMLGQSLWAGGMIAAALISFAYYGRRAKKEFGGITGDTAGWFVLICEENMMIAAAATNVLAAAVGR